MKWLLLWLPRGPEISHSISLFCTENFLDSILVWAPRSPQNYLSRHAHVHSPPGLPIQLRGKGKQEVERREESGSQNPASYFGLSHTLVV